MAMTDDGTVDVLDELAGAVKRLRNAADWLYESSFRGGGGVGHRLYAERADMWSNQIVELRMQLEREKEET